MELVKSKIKRLIMIVFLSLFLIPAGAQVLKFKTTAFASNSYNYTTERWSGWSDWERSNMLVTINLNTDVVTIYSPVTQRYQIYDGESSYYDSDGDLHMVYKFIDQDYDKGVMRLLQRQSGASEIYIEFANIRWCYRVIRI